MIQNMTKKEIPFAWAKGISFLFSIKLVFKHSPFFFATGLNKDILP